MIRIIQASGFGCLFYYSSTGELIMKKNNSKNLIKTITVAILVFSVGTAFALNTAGAFLRSPMCPLGLKVP